MKNKLTLLNIVSSFLLQVCLIFSGFIIPKLILTYFGSTVNGLVSSLNQFLSYITLLEGGVTGIITASLYKPLVNNDNKKISAIVKTSCLFFRKIGLFYIIYSILLAIIYPLFIHSFSFIYIFVLTLILSLNMLIQYMFSLTFKILLSADKKVYIVSFVQVIIVILNIVLSVLIVHIYPNIRIFKLINGALYIIQPIIFNHYIKKYYNIDYSVPEDKELIKNRWNGFAINVAAFIHYSTDITILTIFTNLKTVSIYSVYCLVTCAIRQLISSVSTGINPVIGQAYAKGDYNDLNNKLDLYEYFIFISIFLLFSVSALLITPFVLLYTSGINDTNYYQPLFGTLLIISEALYLIKFPHLNLAYAANKFKEITKPAYIEATINIILSIILVNKFGLVGVTIGTIIAMIYRMIFHVKFTSKIINRNQNIFYSKLLIFMLSTFVGIGICHFLISPVKIEVVNWLWHGIAYVFIMGITYFITSLLFFKKELLYCKKYLRR